MTESLTSFESPSMISDVATQASLNAFIARTLHALSTPESGIAAYFADPDIMITGPGLDECFIGPEMAQTGARWMATLGIRWEPKIVMSWMQGDIAWTRIRIDGHKMERGAPGVIPYLVTGIFRRKTDGWTWLYWGGAEPQKESRLYSKRDTGRHAGPQR